MKQLKTTSLIVLAALLVPVLAQASTGGADYSAITDSVNWVAVGAAILAIAALKAAPLVVKAGSKMVLSMIGGR